MNGREAFKIACKDAKACKGEYKRLCENDDWFQVMLDNWGWVCNKLDMGKLFEHCDLSKLDGIHWSVLLRGEPELAEHCDFEKLNGSNWTRLLIYQPQLKKYRT